MGYSRDNDGRGPAGCQGFFDAVVIIVVVVIVILLLYLVLGR